MKGPSEILDNQPFQSETLQTHFLNQICYVGKYYFKSNTQLQNNNINVVKLYDSGEGFF